VNLSWRSDEPLCGNNYVKRKQAACPGSCAWSSGFEQREDVASWREGRKLSRLCVQALYRDDGSIDWRSKEPR
jgi:hypothetical protein